MNEESLAFLGIRAVSNMIRRGDISSMEVTRILLDRIELLNPKMNAYILVLRNEALAEARLRDEESKRGKFSGLLHGIPVAIKDIIAIRGAKMTCGSKIMQNKVTSKDAAVVKKLRNAGAVILGKLNLHEFAYGVTSENPHYGPSLNPWDLSRITGGSSGGSGAAVAAGLCYAALGTDTGGSIRIPASLCGIVGLKPTFGVTSTSGVFPLSWSLDHVGALTRRVDDASIMFNAMRIRDSNASVLRSQRLDGKMNDNLEGKVIGVLEETFEGTNENVVTGVKAAVQIWEKAGFQMQDVSFPHLREARAAATIVLASEASAHHEQLLRQLENEYGEDVRSRLKMGLLFTGTEYVNAQRIRRMIKRNLTSLFKKVDAIVLPTTPIAAFHVGEKPVDSDGTTIDPRVLLTRFTSVFNLVGTPAISVPCGINPLGLPFGVQIVCKPFDESLILDIADVLESSLKCYLLKPPMA